LKAVLLLFAAIYTISIEGYTEPLNEGDDLTLMCILTPPDADIPEPVIFFTQTDSRIRQSLLSGGTYAKSNISVEDGGEYTCVAGVAEDSVTVMVLAARDSGNVAALLSSSVDKALTAPIVGLSIAALIAFMMITVCMLRKRRHSLAIKNGRYHFIYNEIFVCVFSLNSFTSLFACADMVSPIVGMDEEATL
jgi:hypothetical protein